MKYGLIVTPPAADQTCKNIGDYVQTVAAMQYYPRIDYYIQREYVSEYQGVECESTKVVLNSWWMWHPENWPPHDSIQPLPISMHISPLCADKMLSGSGYEWFKRYEPIGCRDLSSLQTLQNRGIKSYFSACLTLTLYKQFPPVEKSVRSGICFVDPYLPSRAGLLYNLEMLCYCLFHPFTVFKLSEKHYFNIAQSYNGLVQKSRKNRMRSLRFAAYFHKIYSTLFSNDVLLNADYIHHIYDVSKTENKDDKKLINLAVQLVEKYRTQRYVITSRIHCALPCLAMETPVIFVQHPDIVGAVWNTGRLGGLMDFFRCVTVSDKGISTEDEVLRMKSRIDKNYSFQNKNNWRSFAKDLQKTVENFFKQ